MSSAEYLAGLLTLRDYRKNNPELPEDEEDDEETGGYQLDLAPVFN